MDEDVKGSELDCLLTPLPLSGLYKASVKFRAQMKHVLYNLIWRPTAGELLAKTLFVIMELSIMQSIVILV